MELNMINGPRVWTPVRQYRPQSSFLRRKLPFSTYGGTIFTNDSNTALCISSNVDHFDWILGSLQVDSDGRITANVDDWRDTREGGEVPVLTQNSYFLPVDTRNSLAPQLTEEIQSSPVDDLVNRGLIGVVREVAVYSPEEMNKMLLEYHGSRVKYRAKVREMREEANREKRRIDMNLRVELDRMGEEPTFGSFLANS